MQILSCVQLPFTSSHNDRGHTSPTIVMREAGGYVPLSAAILTSIANVVGENDGYESRASNT